MITLRDVAASDWDRYSRWKNDTRLSEYLSRTCPEGCDALTYDPLKTGWFIISAEEQDIGAVWLEKDPEDPAAAILGIFILEDSHRGKGAGRTAIEEAITISRKRFSFNKVKLNVRKSNLRALNCYLRCGFLVLAEGKKWTSGGTRIEYYTMERKMEG